MQAKQVHPIPAYSFWEHYIKNGINEDGHQWTECTEIDWALGLVPKSKDEQAKWKDYSWQKTIDYLKKNPANIFLSYLYPDQIDTAAIGIIKKMGIACVNFFCDHVREYKNVPAEFGVFDLNWVPEYKAIRQYHKAGYAFVHLPMPMWIAPELRVPTAESNLMVTFIGSRDIQRQMLFEKVLAKQPKIPLAIYGTGWQDEGEQVIPHPRYTFNKKLFHQYSFIKNNGVIPYLRKIKYRDAWHEVTDALAAKSHGNISFDTYNTLTAQSMVTLGVNRYPSYRYPFGKPNTYSRLRDIEAPMLGACYLTEWTEGLDELYDIEKEINVYRNADELIGQVAVLQSNSQKRKLLRINGQKKALDDHSIPRSLTKILAALNLTCT